MRRHLVLAVALAAAGSSCAAAAESWIFRTSYYSHDPATGKRVNQFAAEKPAYVRTDPTYQESVYRQSRTGFAAVGGAYDFMHTVETWGQGESIRPYGEWLYPYRAGATPYGPWGNPQGPWTTPFGSWGNPYGLGDLPNSPWGSSGPMAMPYAAPTAPQPGHSLAVPATPSQANPSAANPSPPRPMFQGN